MADLYRTIKEGFDRLDNHFDELTETMRVPNPRFSSLEHEARKPSLTTEADVETDYTKTRKRTKSASAADRVKNGDCSSARVGYGPTSLTSFGMIAKPPLAPEK